jgi:hypothetical protein
VKAVAFLPAADGNTSVFRTSGVADQGVWKIGGEKVSPFRGPILGRGDIEAHRVLALGLLVVPREPSARHADITHWPAEKDAKKSLAQLLAADAVLSLAPKPHPLD